MWVKTKFGIKSQSLQQRFKYVLHGRQATILSVNEETIILRSVIMRLV